METNKLLSNNLFGFCPGRSTTNALFSTTKFIYENLDKSKKVIAIFLDLAKAFDAVDHNILINILPNFFIKGESLGWFSSYLHSRTQIESLNNTVSREGQIVCGEPQGSVLGSILFNLYINCICDLNIGGSMVTYADDNCILFSDISLYAVHKKATWGLSTVQKKIK